MLVLKASLPGPLDEYGEGIRLLHCAFPEQWGITSQADDEMRAERWERIRRQTEARVNNWVDLLSKKFVGIRDIDATLVRRAAPTDVLRLLVRLVR